MTENNSNEIALCEEKESTKFQQVISKVEDLTFKTVEKICPSLVKYLTTEDYGEKIAFCEKLGAKKFQKVVFQVEGLKYKVIKNLCPKFMKHYDKFCDRKRDKKLATAKTKEEKKQIINDYRMLKMVMRKEFNREQNRNYHMDPNKPTEILYYLNWNKEVHKKGIIKNLITIPGIALVSAISTATGIFPIGIGITALLMLMETGSLFVNFQCVNIQNCNIYRYKEREQSLQKIHQQKIIRNVRKYEEGSKAVAKSFNETKNIPTTKMIYDNAETLEELRQLRSLIKTTFDTNIAIEEQRKEGRSK